MKNVFVLTHLFLGAGYASAFGAQLAGVLPSGLLSFPVCIGGYVVAATIALAVHDYSDPRTPRAPRRTRQAPNAAKPAAAPGIAQPTWGYRTLSA